MAAAAGAGGGEELLPEDRFHAQDALSMHFVRQREEELVKKRQKEAARERERAEEAAKEESKPAPAIDSALLTDLL